MMRLEYLKWVLNPIYLLLALIATAVYINRDGLIPPHAEHNPDIVLEEIPVTEKAPPEAEPAPEPQPLTSDAVAMAPVNGTTPASVASHPLDSARIAAREGRWEQAIKHYRQAMESEPSEYEAAGELGNLLVRLGRPGQAAEAYYRAADALIAKGHGRSVWPMLPLIEYFTPEKAAALRERLVPRQTNFKP